MRGARTDGRPRRNDARLRVSTGRRRVVARRRSRLLAYVAPDWTTCWCFSIYVSATLSFSRSMSPKWPRCCGGVSVRRCLRRRRHFEIALWLLVVVVVHMISHVRLHDADNVQSSGAQLIPQANVIRNGLQREGSSLREVDDHLNKAMQRAVAAGQATTAATRSMQPTPAPATTVKPDKGKKLMDFLTGRSRNKNRRERDQGSQLHSTADGSSALNSAVLHAYRKPLPLPPRLWSDRQWATVGSSFSGAYADGLSSLQDLATKVQTSSGPGSAADSPDVEALLQQIARWNAHGPVLNYNSNDGSDSMRSDEATFDYVVAVMASSRVSYLSLLLEVLDRMPCPDSVLVIISHDGLDGPTLDAVSMTVKNVRVKQLVFPLGRSFLGGHFPARAPNDCTEDVLSGGRSPQGCYGDTDSYGHYRDETTTTVKHHWWWLQNYLWDVFPLTRGFDGFALFLEEDHLVSDDLHAVLEGLTGLLKSGAAGSARFLSLDNGHGHEEAVSVTHRLSFASSGRYFDFQYVESATYLFMPVLFAAGRDTLRGSDMDSTRITTAEIHARWGGNLGYGWNRSTWELIREETWSYCSGVDDSNWDASFEVVLNRLLSKHSRDSPQAAKATEWACVRPVVRRIQHIGTCGTHLRQSSHCTAKVRDWAPAIADYASKLQPAAEADGQLVVLPTWSLQPATSLRPAALYGGQPNGGWGDLRDRALCNMLPNMQFGLDESIETVADQGKTLVSPQLLKPEQVLTMLPFVAE